MVHILFSAKRRAYFCKSIAIEMGGVSRYFSKVSGVRGQFDSPEDQSGKEEVSHHVGTSSKLIVPRNAVIQVYRSDSIAMLRDMGHQGSWRKTHTHTPQISLPSKLYKNPCSDVRHKVSGRSPGRPSLLHWGQHSRKFAKEAASDKPSGCESLVACCDFLCQSSLAYPPHSRVIPFSRH